MVSLAENARCARALVTQTDNIPLVTKATLGNNFVLTYDDQVTIVLPFILEDLVMIFLGDQCGLCAFFSPYGSP